MSALTGVTDVPVPRNEPVLGHAPGSPERAALQSRIAELDGTPHELTGTVGGVRRMGDGERIDVVSPHRRHRVLGVTAQATPADVEAAVAAARDAAPGWQALPFDERA